MHLSVSGLPQDLQDGELPQDVEEWAEEDPLQFEKEGGLVDQEREDYALQWVKQLQMLSMKHRGGPYVTTETTTASMESLADYATSPADIDGLIGHLEVRERSQLLYMGGEQQNICYCRGESDTAIDWLLLQPPPPDLPGAAVNTLTQGERYDGQHQLCCFHGDGDSQSAERTADECEGKMGAPQQEIETPHRTTEV